MQFTLLSGKRVFQRCTVVYRSPRLDKPPIRVRSFLNLADALRQTDDVSFSRRFFSCIGANFTAYQEIKKLAHKWQPDVVELPSYQHMVIGLISGAMGPFSNAPIDTIKTRASYCFILI